MIKKKLYLFIFFLSLFLIACGQQNTGINTSEIMTQDERSEEERSAYDWRVQDWSLSDIPCSEGPLYVERYISGLEYEPEEEYEWKLTRYRNLGANFYALDIFSENIYYISGYEDATGEIWHRLIELPELEEYEGMDQSFISFDIRSPQEFVLFMLVKEEDDICACLAMHYTCDGEYLSAVDLYPAVKECGEDKISGVYVDQECRYYLIPYSLGDNIIITDANGKLLQELVTDREDASVFLITKTAKGEPIFEWTHLGEWMQLFMYDPTANKEKILTEQLPAYSFKAINEDGFLYYGNNGKLYRWDLINGGKELCFNYEETGLGRNEGMTNLGIDESGFPLLMDRSREKVIICKLGREPGEEQEEIRLVSLVEDCAYIEASTIIFSQSNAEYPISVQQPEGDIETFRNRMMAELTAGDGADIYYVSGEDMHILYEKGVLADLSDVLPEELCQLIYTGALNCGMIDGQKVGIAPSAYMSTLMISDELWPESSWTLEEAVTLMEEHPEISRLMATSMVKGKEELIHTLLFQDMPNSPFLEMETGTCDFANPLFAKVLELTKNITVGQSSAAAMNNGTAAAFMINMDNFYDFSNDMSQLGEGYHCVGFPTQTGQGSYWNADYYLVINAQTPYREEINAYLASLFSRERQEEADHPIRNDLIDSLILYVEEDPYNPWMYSIGGGTYKYLEVKPDGTTWKQEYEAIMESGVPCAMNTSFIEEIVMEEVKIYLNENRSAEETAETIQNRVQLYLNEQQ